MQAILEQSTSVVAFLAWRLPGGEPREFQLREGESVTIGSESGVDIQLDHPEVAGKHCIIWIERGRVTVRDCYSTSGTYVDDRRISETVLDDETEGEEIRIGSCVLTLTRTAAEGGAGDLADTLAPFREPGDAELTPEQLQFQLARSRAEIARLQGQLKHQDQENAAPLPGDPFQEEMIQLLRTEVLELQRAIGDPPAEQGTERDPSDEDVDLPTREEVERLALRLEQLLEELEGRDEQVGLLEELLHTAEEANRAEQEVRGQLDGWVDDIEVRFSQREQEWRAEIEKLQRAADELTAERDRAETALAAENSNEQVQALQELAQSLRGEIEQLRNSLRDSDQERQELQGHLEDFRIAARQEAVQLSRERAELARLRHELESKRQTAAPRENQPMASPNERIHDVQQELRNHHKQQKQEKQEQRERSLSQRLGRLWKRIEGR